jgi:acyl-CoA thioester hydrolase
LPALIPTDRYVHTTSVKVRFYELDPYDHVNHTNYFAYFETARIEFLAEMGWGLDQLKQQGFQFVVVDISARFHAAARYGEDLTIHTSVADAGRVKITWEQVILRGDEVIAEITISGAMTDLDGRPRRIPAQFFDRMESLTP